MKPCPVHRLPQLGHSCDLARFGTQQNTRPVAPLLAKAAFKAASSDIMHDIRLKNITLPAWPCRVKWSPRLKFGAWQNRSEICLKTAVMPPMLFTTLLRTLTSSEYRMSRQGRCTLEGCCASRPARKLSYAGRRTSALQLGATLGFAPPPHFPGGR